LLDKNGGVVDQAEADEPLTAIENLLKKRSLKLENLDEISSHPGPGSFTGLRIGAAVAGALNYALGKKVKPPDLHYE